MTTDTKISRRKALSTSALMAMTAGAGAFGRRAFAAQSGKRSTARNRAQLAELQKLLAEPASRARISAKVRGSVADETVYTFCRLHLYLWTNEGNLTPAFTMQNLSADSWKSLPTGNYQATHREVGVYTRFDTDEVLDVWQNPITGDQREVWHYVGGPLFVEIGPDGIINKAKGASLSPREMRMDVLGETLVIPNQSSISFPSPFKPEEWPKEAGAPAYYWDSHFYFAARIADVLDPDLTSAPSAVQFQNMVSFHPWLGMGRLPGRTYGKGLGAKLTGLDDLPAGARAALEKRTPEIFDLPSWKSPRIDFVEYMQKRKPT